MIFIFRIVFGVTLAIIVSILGSFFCLFNPRNPNNVARFAHLFSFTLTPFLGIKLVSRVNSKCKNIGSCVFIANHQNNYDMLVAGKIVQPRTVTVGKKSLVWIPFFGPLYWLCGNILLDRDNKTKARDTLIHIVNEIHRKKLSIWMFPEGTRSQGRGLLPFKTGAFRTAITAGVPIVPICVSNTNKIRFGIWDNGYMITEMLDPIETAHLKKEDAKQLMETCYQLMAEKIKQLDEEVKQLNKKK